MLTTIITFDVYQIKKDAFSFSSFRTAEERKKAEADIDDMQGTLLSLESIFDGEVQYSNMTVSDKYGNKIIRPAVPVALHVPRPLTQRELKYIKEIDVRLIAVV